MPGLKQGPVRFTMVPPSMFPFSGANTSGRFDPTREHMIKCTYKKENKITDKLNNRTIHLKIFIYPAAIFIAIHL